MLREYVEGLDAAVVHAEKVTVDEEKEMEEEKEMLQQFGFLEKEVNAEEQDDDDVLFLPPPLPTATGTHTHTVSPGQLAKDLMFISKHINDFDEEVQTPNESNVGSHPTSKPTSSPPPQVAQLKSPSARALTRRAAHDVMSSKVTMPQLVKQASACEYGSLPDIPKPIKEKEELDLYERLILELQPNEDTAPDFDYMANVWNKKHVFPTLVFDNGRNAYVPGPLYFKDAKVLRDHYKTFSSKHIFNKAKAAMPGGEEGYMHTIKQAHTSRGGTAEAPRFSPSLPSTSQPLNQLNLQPPNPLFLADTRQTEPCDTADGLRPTGALAGVVASASVEPSNRSTTQVGKPKYCKNCGSRRGEKYDHPCGKSFKPCSYEKDQFKDNPEALLCTNT